jgi:hypothetical protein
VLFLGKRLNILLNMEIIFSLTGLKSRNISYDIYFGPKPHKAKKSNWIHRISGKG